MPRFLDAVRSGDLAAVQADLARQPALVDARDEAGVSAVLLALYRGQREVADALLAAGADLDVFAASALGEDVRLELLLDLDPGLVAAWSADGYTALHLACFFGEPEAVRRLLDSGAATDAVARNPMEVQPLHSAAATSQAEICQMLLDAGAPVDARQQGGFTALHAAGHSGNRELVELLLAQGADASVRTTKGQLATDLALEAGHVHLADELASACRS